MSRRPPRSLSPSAQRALPTITAGLARGLGANQIYDLLQSSGQGYRRTNFLSDLALIRDVDQKAARLATLAGDRHPDPSRLPFALTKQLREYSFRVRVSGYNPDTGQREDRFFSISTNELLSRDEIESIALSHSTNVDHYAPFEPDEVQLEGGTRR